MLLVRLLFLNDHQPFSKGSETRLTKNSVSKKNHICRIIPEQVQISNHWSFRMIATVLFITSQPCFIFPTSWTKITEIIARTILLRGCIHVKMGPHFYVPDSNEPIRHPPLPYLLFQVALTIWLINVLYFRPLIHLTLLHYFTFLVVFCSWL